MQPELLENKDSDMWYWDRNLQDTQDKSTVCDSRNVDNLGVGTKLKNLKTPAVQNNIRSYYVKNIKNKKQIT